MCIYHGRLAKGSLIIRHVNSRTSLSPSARFINNEAAQNNSTSPIRKYPQKIKPFPSPINVGTDICHVPRIQELLTKGTSNTAGDPRADINLHFLRRLFTDWELHHNRHIFLREWRTPIATARFIAGRWAAKEAVMKACLNRSLSFSDIAIVAYTGAPFGVVLDPVYAAYLKLHRKNREQAEYPVSLSTESIAPSPSSEGSFVPLEKSLTHQSSLSPPASVLVSAHASTTSESLVQKALKPRWIGPYSSLLSSALPGDLKGQEVRISISHDGEYVTAVAMVYNDENREVSRVMQNHLTPELPIQ